uniref:Reticulon-like protein n=1 Tax=Oncorhynchus tshawytscha TaxID=74940 RepID=A0AAZ3S6E5_ONCTS
NVARFINIFLKFIGKNDLTIKLASRLWVTVASYLTGVLARYVSLVGTLIALGWLFFKLHFKISTKDVASPIITLPCLGKGHFKTAKLQLAKQKAQDHPVDEGCQEKIQEIKQDIIKNKAALSEILQNFKYD